MKLKIKISVSNVSGVAAGVDLLASSGIDLLLSTGGIDLLLASRGEQLLLSSSSVNLLASSGVDLLTVGVASSCVSLVVGT
jgi:hypothetical protein